MSLVKALADLRAQGLRAVLSWVAIAVGTTAVMAAFGAHAVLDREIARSFEDSRPPAVVVWTDAVDADLLRRVASLPGVAGAEARRQVRARAEVGDGTWRSVLIYAIRDFDDMRVSKVHALDGSAPPSVGSALVEQSAVSVLGTERGATLALRIATQREKRSLVVSGWAHDPAQAPGWQDDVAYLYVTPATLSALGLTPQLDQLHIDVAGDDNAVAPLAREIQRTLRAANRPVHRVEVPVRRHPHADHMEAMLGLIRVLAVLSLLLSALLAASLFGALLARQTREVGIMKAIGGSPGAIARSSLWLALILSGTAAFTGVGVGILAGQRFARFAARELNLYDVALTVPGGVIAAVFGAGIAVPVAASAWPILRASRINVREALTDPGLRGEKPASVGAATRRRGALVTLSLRHALRSRARFALNVTSLALGGAMLMTAANVHRSLVAAVDASVAPRTDRIELRLLEPAPTTALVTAAASVKGVRRAVPWGAVRAGIALPDDTSAPPVVGHVAVLGPPEGSLPKTTRLVEGRWPVASSQAETVSLAVNRQLLATVSDLHLGAPVNLVVGGRATPATIVAVVEEVGIASAYVAPAGMAHLLGRDDVSGALRLELHDEASSVAVAARLESVLARENWFPHDLVTRASLRAAMRDHFRILLVVLLTLAGAAIAVGVLGLATTMSINVIARRREMGVLKSMGATAGHIRRLVLLEGAVATTASVLFALALSFPLSAAVRAVVGAHGLHVTLPREHAIEAVGAWLVLAGLCTVGACLGPARDAVRRPVRELIGYA
ncbi:MAG: FtsX-like permease family protein [Myxococcota bacterium]